MKDALCASGMKGGNAPAHFTIQIHADARQQGLPGTIKQRFRLRVLADKLLLVAVHQGSEAGTIEGFHDEAE